MGIYLKKRHTQSVYILMPLTEEAKDWVKTNVHYESYQALGKGIVVEHRYIGDIAQGMVDDGLIMGVDFDIN